MRAFAALYAALQATPLAAARIRLLADYFMRTPDPDRGWALALLLGAVPRPAAKPGLIKALAAGRLDPALLALSQAFVGDAAETLALMWPEPVAEGALPLAEVVADLPGADARCVAGWLDKLDARGRCGLLKLVTGTMDFASASRLAMQALARLRSDAPLATVESLCLGLAPPYRSLFGWLLAGQEQPTLPAQPVFHPLMFPAPLQQELPDLAGCAIEWCWPGPLAQIVAIGGQRRLYDSDGADLSAAFPDVLAGLPDGVVLDGSLFVLRDGVVAPPAEVRQRMGRRRATPRMLAESPAYLRVHDLLALNGQDFRALPFRQRRQHLQTWLAALRPPRLDMSPLLSSTDWRGLGHFAEQNWPFAATGLVLKMWDSPYLAGRDHGQWHYWPRPPAYADCVLLYVESRPTEHPFAAQPLFTVGAWTEQGDLVPIGKAESALDESELLALQEWCRAHVTDRFGPVRQILPERVVRIGFNHARNSPRHKAGLVLEGARLHRVMANIPAHTAITINSLRRFIR